MSDGTPDILLQIAADRAERVKVAGPEQGLDVPAERMAPLVDFINAGSPSGPPADADPRSGILIAEVKRRSPSKGHIADIPEPAELAGLYAAAGFRRVSVLTEEARFGGSLADLMAVKSARPELAVLRKDFLLSVEDVEVSWRAGADAILLIATLLESDVLEAMYRRATGLGLTCLVEVHDKEDVAKARRFSPPLVGINSRDLRKFKVEPLLPLETRSFIDWDCRVIYESGILRPDDAAFVRGTGFSGFLVGEAVARSPELATGLLEAWDDESEARRRYGAWERLYRRYRPGVPLVKICGITNRQDAEVAVEAGADMLGFIFAPSPRLTSPEVVRACMDLPVLKAAVVVLGPDDELPPALQALLAEGALDFIQFHGDEPLRTTASWPGYKAVNLKMPGDAGKLEVGADGNPGTPAVLVDAFSPDARGGTGKLLDESLVEAVTARRRLWLAGGLTPENVAGIARQYSPGLVDVSSGTEAEKGKKDHDKVRRFVAAAKGRTL